MELNETMNAFAVIGLWSLKRRVATNKEQSSIDVPTMMIKPHRVLAVRRWRFGNGASCFEAKCEASFNFGHARALTF